MFARMFAPAFMAKKDGRSPTIAFFSRKKNPFLKLRRRPAATGEFPAKPIFACDNLGPQPSWMLAALRGAHNLKDPRGPT